jgi:hypothetical protein
MRAQAIAFYLCLVVPAIVTQTSPTVGQHSPEAKSIGKVAIVTGSVTIEHTAGVALLAKLTPSVGAAKAGDAVYIGDVIQTGPDGKAGITFSDGTAFNLSSNARMVLDEFVYDPNGKSNATVFSLTKGTFTLVAGQVAKTGTMKVETPVATMGIRGTTPHVEIADDGTVSFATLIEEGKEKALKKKQKRGVPVKERRADNQIDRLKDLDNNINIKLKICQGC